MARQGIPFATALELRVVYPLKEGEDPSTPLRDVPRDGKTMGEVVTRGNITMKGQMVICQLRSFLTFASEYFRDREATKKAFRGGWYNLGDLAVHYPDNTIALLDRTKDIIISGGEVSDVYTSLCIW
jgi:acyl-CoA synthetase (AMP-forming)/AMP-acid ligase II